jgi:ectoine hydroxylase-related dioxygenase (phytanoyl-CoA dioxygenase family)
LLRQQEVSGRPAAHLRKRAIARLHFRTASTGRLWHGGGTNHSGDRRFAISNYYCAGFIRQQENQYLGIRADTARLFPRRLQELRGYSVYKGLYGHVDNEDPITMLGRSSDTRMIWQQSYDEMFETQAPATAKR